MIRKFIVKLTIFIVPLLLFWIYAEIGLNYVPTSYSKLQHNFYLYRNDIEVLILGNSESQLGIAPKYFQKYKGYNLSNVSQPIYASSQLVLNNLEELKNLKLVVISVGPLSFFTTSRGHREQWREKFYYHFWGLDPEYGEPNYTWNFKTGLYNFKTILSYAVQGFYKIPTPYVDAIDSTGWERGYIKNSYEILNDETGEMIARIHLESVNFSYNHKNVEYIANLKKELDKKGVKLIIIQLPKSKYYLKNLPEELMIKNNLVLDSIYRHMDVPYYCFTSDPNYTDQDFRDVNHLNYIGAKKFSKTLSQVIENKLK